MKASLFILFSSLLVSLCNAQEVLPKGDSYFLKAGFTQPFNTSGYFGHSSSNSYSYVHFQGGASLSGGFIHNGKRLSIIPALRTSYLQGSTSYHEYMYKNSEDTYAQFNIVNLGGEMTFSARLGKYKNVNLGLGLQAGFSIYKDVTGTTTTASYLYYSNTQAVSKDAFGNSYAGVLIDLRVQPKKLVKNNFAGSFGFRFHSNMISNEGSSLIHSYSEAEVYLALNFWSRKKAFRDSTGTIHLTDTTEEKEYKVTHYDVEIPKGMSYFIQPSFNKTINYDQADGTHNMSGTFKPSASMALGCNLVKGRLAFSPLIKYTYVRGRAEGGDIEKYDKYQTMYFDSKFNIGIMSAEFILSRIMGPNKRFFMGVGAIAGTSVSQNISGTITHSTWGFNKSTEQINNNYFASYYGGGLLDLKYYLSKNVRPNCGAAIGGKWIVVNSNIPYKKTMSQVEIYLNYTFWKKRTP